MSRQGSWRWVWVASAAALLAVGGCRKKQAEQPAQPKPPSAESLALHAMAGRARLDSLRWPNFADLKQPVEDFYGAHSFEPVWLNGTTPTPQARQMMAAFAACSSDALDPEDYDSPRWLARAAAIHTPEDRAAFDMAMTVSAMRYLNDEHNGRVNPKRFNFGIDINQKRYDLAKFLSEKIIASSNVGAVLVTVPPQSNEYRRTLAAYRHWVELAKQDAGGGLADPGRQLKPGDAYAGAARMRALLAMDGDLTDDTRANASGAAGSAATGSAITDTPAQAGSPSSDDAPRRYDPAWLPAVKHFQFHHGLTADGKIGAPTIAAMNVPTAERVHQLAIALERWRWLPEVYQNAPIFVNLPEFRLRVYSSEAAPQLNLKPPDQEEADVVHASEGPGPANMTSDHTAIALEMNVVTGKAGIKPPDKPGEAPEDHQTPMLVNMMRYLILRPYWLVPVDITKREVIPGIAKDPNYLEAHNFSVVDHHQHPVAYTPAIDEQLLHGRLTVRQNAGDDNSLGLVKFMFPNPYSIYLHSTPAVGLFTRTRRDYSHGCVRLQKPLALAAWVLRDRSEWPPEKIDAAMKNGEDNKTVVLKQTIPVNIFYATAYVEPDGTVDFTRDIYGYDRLLDETLAVGRPYPVKAVAPVVDVHDER